MIPTKIKFNQVHVQLTCHKKKKKKVRVQLTLTTGIWQQSFGDEILEKMEKYFIWNKETEECAENS